MCNHMHMKRTTILADEKLIIGLKDLAQRRGTTVAGLVRDVLEEYVAKHRPRGQIPSFAGIGDSGRRDVSGRVDEMLAEEIDRAEGWPVRGASR